MPAHVYLEICSLRSPSATKRISRWSTRRISQHWPGVGVASLGICNPGSGVLGDSSIYCFVYATWWTRACVRFRLRVYRHKTTAPGPDKGFSLKGGRYVEKIWPYWTNHIRGLFSIPVQWMNPGASISRNSFATHYLLNGMMVSLLSRYISCHPLSMKRDALLLHNYPKCAKGEGIVLSRAFFRSFPHKSFRLLSLVRTCIPFTVGRIACISFSKRQKGAYH